MIILVMVIMCESYVLDLVIPFDDDDVLAYTFEMMNRICLSSLGKSTCDLYD